MKRIEPYLEGEKVGPYELVLIKRLPNRRGIFKCECGKEFEAAISNVSRGNVSSCGCKRFHYKPGDLLGPDKIELVRYTNKDKNRKWFGDFICPRCGQTFNSRINNVVKGETRSCGCIRDKKFYDKIHSYSYKEIAGEKAGVWTALYRTERQDKNHTWYWMCQCENGHYHEILSSNFGKTLTCPFCTGESSGERKVRITLEQLKIEYKQQYSFSECKRINLLKFDFYLPDYNCCVEYDGEQHFEPSNFFGGEEAFKERQERDEIKNQFCREQNIRLIRIPYWDFNKINEDYILERLENEV